MARFCRFFRGTGSRGCDENDLMPRWKRQGILYKAKELSEFSENKASLVACLPVSFSYCLERVVASVI